MAEQKRQPNKLTLEKVERAVDGIGSLVISFSLIASGLAMLVKGSDLAVLYFGLAYVLNQLCRHAKTDK